MLALVAIGRSMEIWWDALDDLEWFPCNYDEGKIMVLPSKLTLARRSASGDAVREGERPEAKPRYQEELGYLWNMPG